MTQIAALLATLRAWYAAHRKVIRSQARHLLGVALFAALHALLGGGTTGTALSAAIGAVTPVLLKWLDPSETDFGLGSSPDPAPDSADPVATDPPPVDSEP